MLFQIGVVRLFVPYRRGLHQPHTLHLSQHRDIRQAFPWGVTELVCCHQCCGSVTFWYGSGSADPYL
jgi:hypothetical protein